MIIRGSFDIRNRSEKPGQIGSLLFDRSAKRENDQGNDRIVLENTMDLITVLSSSGLIRYQNSAIERILGYLPQALVGSNFLEWIHPDDVAAMRVALLQRSSEENFRGIEFRFPHQDGTWKSFEALAHNIVYRGDELTVVVTWREITRYKEVEEKLKKAYKELTELTQALTRTNSELLETNRKLSEASTQDSLTGLLNHKAILAIAHEHFGLWKRYETPFSILMIDVDDFKLINDTFGHLSGDAALKLIAKKIFSRLREVDFASRLGGDEFAVVLPETTREGVEAVGARILEAVRNCSLEADGIPIHPTISLGGATVNSEDLVAEGVFRRADRALYLAKNKSKNELMID